MNVFEPFVCMKAKKPLKRFFRTRRPINTQLKQGVNEKRGLHAYAMPFQAQAAFTLIEVMIATGIFFMAMFAILGVMSQGLRAAGSLKKDGPTAGVELANMATTNKLVPGIYSGDFGDYYPEYKWTYSVDLDPDLTNKLFKVVLVITRNGSADPDSAVTTFLYRPASEQPK